MENRAGIGGALDEYWYGSHEMDRSGSLKKENAEIRIFRCAPSRSGSGVEAVD